MKFNRSLGTFALKEGDFLHALSNARVRLVSSFLTQATTIIPTIFTELGGNNFHLPHIIFLRPKDSKYWACTLI